MFIQFIEAVIHSLIHQIQIIGNMRREKKKDYSLRGKNKSNSECNSHNGSLLEVNEKRWGYFSSKIIITIQAKLSYMGLFFIKNLSTIWIQVCTQIYVLYTSWNMCNMYVYKTDQCQLHINYGKRSSPYWIVWKVKWRPVPCALGCQSARASHSKLFLCL